MRASSTEVDEVIYSFSPAQNWLPWLQICFNKEVGTLGSYDPSHLQNFAYMPIFGLMLLVYGAQFVNHPQMSRSKSSKMYP